MAQDLQLQLLTCDLGLRRISDEQGRFFHALLKQSASELKSKGVELRDDDAGDDLFVVSYAAWLYRSRSSAGSDTPALPESLRLQIRDRQIAAIQRRVSDASL